MKITQSVLDTKEFKIKLDDHSKEAMLHILDKIFGEYEFEAGCLEACISTLLCMMMGRHIIAITNEESYSEFLEDHAKYTADLINSVKNKKVH